MPEGLNDVTAAYGTLRSIEDNMLDYNKNRHIFGDAHVDAKRAALLQSAQPHLRTLEACIGNATDLQLQEWVVRRFGEVMMFAHPAIKAEADRRGVKPAPSAFGSPKGVAPKA